MKTNKLKDAILETAAELLTAANMIDSVMEDQVEVEEEQPIESPDVTKDEVDRIMDDLDDMKYCVVDTGKEYGPVVFDNYEDALACAEYWLANKPAGLFYITLLCETHRNDFTHVVE